TLVRLYATRIFGSSTIESRSIGQPLAPSVASLIFESCLTPRQVDRGHARRRGSKLAPRSTMPAKKLALALSIVLAAACASTGTDGYPAGDQLEGKADGFFFQRAIDPVALDWNHQADGHFHVDQYAAFVLRGERGRTADILSWTDWHLDTNTAKG